MSAEETEPAGVGLAAAAAAIAAAALPPPVPPRPSLGQIRCKRCRATHANVHSDLCPDCETGQEYFKVSAAGARARRGQIG